MDTTRIIKTLVILEIVLAVLSVSLSIVLESQLPQVLRDFLEAELEKEWTIIELICAFVLVPIYLASLFGLLFSRSWAKSLYIFAFVLGYAVFPFFGPYIEHRIPATLDYLASAIGGAIVALLVFSDSVFSKRR